MSAAILSVTGRIAESSPDKQVLVVFDEFQEIRNFNDDRIERILRSEVQKHHNVAYIFCGSRKHMIREMFLKSGSPLYRSAGHYPIDCIAVKHWIPYIKERFQMQEISLEDGIIEDICVLTDGHPYYTQMICGILWDSCESGRNRIRIGSPKKSSQNTNSLIRRAQGTAWNTLLNMIISNTGTENITSPTDSWTSGCNEDSQVHTRKLLIPGCQKN